MLGKDVCLADGLISSAVNKLRRPVSSKQYQPFTGQACFNQRGVQVSHRRTGRHDHRNGLAANFRNA